MSNPAYDTLVLCLEQKSIFMKDVYNLTKRIEVESKQEEVFLDDLLSERQNRLERIQKCNNLIENTLKELDETDTKRVEKILSGNVDAVQNDNESYMLELVNSISEFLKNTLKSESIAKKNLEEKRDEARKKLTEINIERAQSGK